MGRTTTLYMMLGYPGAGKTTTANVISQLTGALHLSSDALRAEMFPNPTFSQDEHEKLYKTLDEQSEKLLTEGKSVIYDANLNRLQHRQDKYAICSKTGANSTLVWVQTQKELAKQRATDSSREAMAPKNETLGQMFDRIANVIEVPGADEPYIPIDGTKVTPDYISQVLNLPQTP